MTVPSQLVRVLDAITPENWAQFDNVSYQQTADAWREGRLCFAQQAAKQGVWFETTGTTKSLQPWVIDLEKRLAEARPFGQRYIIRVNDRAPSLDAFKEALVGLYQ